MVWMPLMNAKKNMRRRKSQSPSASPDSSPSKISNRTFFGTGKHKRRVLRKQRDSAVTEASSLSSRSSVQVDSAPWRSENIRDSAPKPDEWWVDVGTPDTIDVYQEVEDGDNVMPKVAINTRVSSRQKKFHNCGFETWVRSREEWKVQMVETVPEKPNFADGERSQIAKGLKKATSQRTYELPRYMALSDLINVYTNIWDGGDL